MDNIGLFLLREEWEKRKPAVLEQLQIPDISKESILGLLNHITEELRTFVKTNHLEAFSRASVRYGESNIVVEIAMDKVSCALDENNNPYMYVPVLQIAQPASSSFNEPHEHNEFSNSLQNDHVDENQPLNE